MNIIRGTPPNYRKAAQKWQAYITHHGKVRYIGIYPSFDGAISARKNKESQLFGEFAYHEGAGT